MFQDVSCWREVWTASELLDGSQDEEWSNTLCVLWCQSSQEGWGQVRVKQVDVIKKIINKSADFKFKANSKFLPIDSGGFGLENVFNRYVSSQISHLQKQLWLKNMLQRLENKNSISKFTIIIKLYTILLYVLIPTHSSKFTLSL